MWIIDASLENNEKVITSLNWIIDQSQKFDFCIGVHYINQTSGVSVLALLIIFKCRW